MAEEEPLPDPRASDAVMAQHSALMGQLGNLVGGLRKGRGQNIVQVSQLKGGTAAAEEKRIKKGMRRRMHVVPEQSPAEELQEQEPDVSDFVLVPEGFEYAGCKGRVQEFEKQGARPSWVIRLTDPVEVEVQPEERRGPNFVLHKKSQEPKPLEKKLIHPEVHVDVKPPFDQDHNIDLDKFVDEWCISRTAPEPLVVDATDPIYAMGLFGEAPADAEDCYAAALFSARTMNLVSFKAKGNTQLSDLLRPEKYTGKRFNEGTNQYEHWEIDEKMLLWSATQAPSRQTHHRQSHYRLGGERPDEGGCWLQGAPCTLLGLTERDVYVKDSLLHYYPRCGFNTAYSSGGKGVCLARGYGFILAMWWRGVPDIHGGNCQYYLTQAVEHLCNAGYYHNIYR